MYGGLRTDLNEYSAPTHDHVLVPETLLKKRKSQEKARAERLAEIEKKKKVSHLRARFRDFDDAQHTHQLDCVDAVDIYTFFRV